MTTKTNNPTEEPADREIVITRVFDAPRDLVFKAWTKLEHLKQWWGPAPFRSALLNEGSP